jgi:hypothetical protein
MVMMPTLFMLILKQKGKHYSIQTLALSAAFSINNV